MNFLYQKLPKDLVYIIEDYAKDRTQYNQVICQLKQLILHYEEIWYWKGKWFGHVPNPCFAYHFLADCRASRQRRIDLWYADVRRLKRPHGKRQPTIKDERKRWKQRFGKKLRPPRRRRGHNIMNFLFQTKRFIELQHSPSKNLKNKHTHIMGKHTPR